jgi:hypothetical protein
MCLAKIDKDMNFTELNEKLLSKCLCQESSLEVSKFQISLPDRFMREELFSPILSSISKLKYEQNIEYYQKHPRQLSFVLGDVIYHAGELLKYIGKYTTSYKFTPLRGDEHDTIYAFLQNQIEKKHKLPHLNSFEYNRNAGRNLQAYIDFYKGIKGYEALVEFKHITVVIAEQAILNNEFPYLPIRYNLHNCNNIPVAPMIEMFNSYEKAREYLYSQQRNTEIDEVIVVGYKKYQNHLGDLENDLNMGKFKRLVLVGSKKTDNQNYKFWQWTYKEYLQLAGKQIKRSLQYQNIALNEPFQKYIKNLEKFKSELTQVGVNENEAESIKTYCLNFFTRQLVIDKEWVKNYFEDIFKEENDLYDALEAAGKGTEKENLKNELLEIINNFIDAFTSPKLEWVNTQKQTDKKYYIVTDKYQTKLLENQISNKVLLTPKNVEQILAHCDTSLPDGQNKFYTFQNLLGKEIEFGYSNKQISKNVFIIPYIFFKYQNPLYYYHLYQRLLEFGEVYILQYEGTEEDRSKMFVDLYKKQEKYKRTHKDRKEFWCPEYEYTIETDSGEEELTETEITIIASFDTVETPKDNQENRTYRRNTLREYFRDTFKIKSDFTKKQSEKFLTDIEENDAISSSEDGLISKEKYKISFKGDAFIQVGEYEQFPKKQNKNYSLVFAKDLQAGDEIILDWNLNLSDLLDLLTGKPDFKKDIEAINKASNLWKDWLRSLLEYYKKNRTEQQAIEEMYNKLNLSVLIKTMQNWLNNNEPNFFPRSNTDLEKIIQKRLSLTPENTDENKTKKDKMKQEAENMQKGSTALIHQVKRELNVYLANQGKGRVLSVLTDKEIQDLVKKAQVKTIQSIAKI